MTPELLHTLLTSSRALAITGSYATLFVCAFALPLFLVVFALLHPWRSR
jgi:hypothetical protein